jgi:hypothetical protein
LTRVLSTLSVAVILSTLAVQAARADTFVDTTCSDKSNPAPTCTARAGSTQTSDGSSKNGSTARGGGTRGCTDHFGNVVACSDPQMGWLGSDGCYYKPTQVSPADAAIYGGAGKGPGGWYEQTCVNAGARTALGSVVWRPDAAATVPPVVVARQAASQLQLVVPVIDASPAPGRAQLVSLPTWLWVQPGAWAAKHATAAAPGVSVTATATPTSVTWALGDGSTVVCHGPGTAFPAGGDPRAASPDCGHTYARSSAGQPGGAFAVTATITWSIGWAGGGQTGTLPDLQTTTAAAFQVAESQALVTGAG